MAQGAEAIESTAEELEDNVVTLPKKRRFPQLPKIPKISKKVMIIAGAVVLVVALALAGLFVVKPMLDKSGKGKKGKGKLAHVATNTAKKKSSGIGGFFGLFSHGKKKGAKKQEDPVERVDVGDEFVLNLSDGGYIRLSLTLDLTPEAGKKADKKTEAKGTGGLGEETAPVRDAIISVVTTKTRAELASDEGKEALKKELIKKINADLGTEKVKKVYFTYFATQ